MFTDPNFFSTRRAAWIILEEMEGEGEMNRREKDNGGTSRGSSPGSTEAVQPEGL